MKYIWGTLRIINFLLAIFMMYAGIATATTPIDPSDPADYGWVYEQRITLVALGTIFFASGFTLFLGKVFQWDRVIGWGLMMVYLCFLFGGIVNWDSSEKFSEGLPNFIASVMVGLLYLRWKYHLFYIEPRVKESHEAKRAALRNRRIDEAYQREHDSRSD